MADTSLGLSMLALGIAQSGGGGEPTAYLKDASVNSNTLTITKKDDTTVTYTPTIPTYTAGNNVQITDGVISATDTTYTAGTNITIEGDVISATGGGSSYTFTNGLTESSGTVSWDLNDRIKAGTNASATHTIMLGQKASGSLSGTSSRSAIIAGDFTDGGGAYSQNGRGNVIIGATNKGQNYQAQGDLHSTGNANVVIGYTTTNNPALIEANGNASLVRSYCKQGQIYANGSTSTVIFDASTYGGSPSTEIATASGLGSCIIGYADSTSTFNETIASGKGSFVQGKGLKALSENQHVIGKYNATDDQNNLLFIVGNGSNDSNRSNAFTVDIYGNVNCAGAITAANIPAPPSEDGEYDLHCSIVSGAITYSWVARS